MHVPLTLGSSSSLKEFLKIMKLNFCENKKVGGVWKIIKIIVVGRILNNVTPLHGKLILIMKK
jgi:hypothetical protein